MRIGIIGAGEIGGTLTRRLAQLGHEVFVTNSRGPSSLAGLAKETGAKAVTALHQPEMLFDLHVRLSLLFRLAFKERRSQRMPGQIHAIYEQSSRLAYIFLRSNCTDFSPTSVQNGPLSGRI